MGDPPSGAAHDCPLCGVLAGDDPLADIQLIRRGEHCAAILNAFPYTAGHLMVVPRRHEADLLALTEAERTELWAMVTDAVTAVNTAYQPQGQNVGINLGRAAGAGVPDHLHVHVIPRWSGDTTFTTTVANLRVLPETLEATSERLRAAWPR